MVVLVECSIYVPDAELSESDYMSVNMDLLSSFIDGKLRFTLIPTKSFLSGLPFSFDAFQSNEILLKPSQIKHDIG